jgi:tetraacyldisaccharide 4'-kinase
MKRNIYYALGRPFSPLYSLVMRVRERLYANGIFRSHSPGVPVISVGNLTMGGTGKTPLVRHLAALLLADGFRPAIISRGYGGATREPINIVSNGHEVLLDADYVGDEPSMLARALPGVMVLTGVVRKLPAARAVEMGADVLLLDDGFQHLAVRRDLDLVLFNADTLAGNSRVFPGGDLREPVKALHRCHGFVLTGVDETNRERAGRFADLLGERFPGRPVFFCGLQATGLIRRDGQGEKRCSLDALSGRSPYGFCGIARPEGFGKTLEQLGIEPAGFHSLPDHHIYRPAVVREICRRAEKAGADCLLCTEKDLVKLGGFDLALPLYALVMELVADPGLERMVVEKTTELHAKREIDTP